MNQKTGKFQNQITTERLVLRPAKTEDWAAVKQLFIDFGTSPYHIYDPIMSTEDEQVKNWTQFTIQEHLLLAITRKDDPAMIGYVCFHIAGEMYDIGYMMDSKYHGCGYATEAAKAAMAVLEKEQKVRHFTAMAAAENLPSIRVLEKLGFEIVEEKVVSFDPAVKKSGTYTERQYQYITK